MKVQIRRLLAAAVFSIWLVSTASVECFVAVPATAKHYWILFKTYPPCHKKNLFF